MKIERLTKKESIEAMNSWVGNSFTVPALNKEYSGIREDILQLFVETKDSITDGVKSYQMDVAFGACLYHYFRNKSWFSDRLASDDGFWRYLSLKVVPDIVGERWGNDNADHYYTKPSRIWLKSIWWYIFLSLRDGDVTATREMLLSRNFSTDTIINLVERTGRAGTNVAVYRAIMKKYDSLEGPTDKDFRKIMKLNTAKALVIEPMFCTDGIPGYVKSLFEELSLI